MHRFKPLNEPFTLDIFVVFLPANNRPFHYLIFFILLNLSIFNCLVLVVLLELGLPEEVYLILIVWLGLKCGSYTFSLRSALTLNTSFLGRPYRGLCRVIRQLRAE